MSAPLSTLGFNTFEPFYWDQAKILLNGTEVGRAEGVMIRVVGTWKPYFVWKQQTPFRVYSYGFIISGKIRICFLDGSIISLMLKQMADPELKFDLVFTLDPKMPNQSGGFVAVKGCKLNYEISLENQRYVIENVEFFAERIE